MTLGKLISFQKGKNNLSQGYSAIKSGNPSSGKKNKNSSIKLIRKDSHKKEEFMETIGKKYVIFSMVLLLKISTTIIKRR